MNHFSKRKLAQRGGAGRREARGEVAEHAHLDALLVEPVRDAAGRHDDDEQREAREVVPQLEQLVLHALGRGGEGALDHLHHEQHRQRRKPQGRGFAFGLVEVREEPGELLEVLLVVLGHRQAEDVPTYRAMCVVW